MLSLAWQPEKADYTEAFGARNKAKKAWYKIGALAGIGVVLASVGLVTRYRSLVTLGVFVAVGFPLSAAVLQPLSVRSFWRKNAASRAPLRAPSIRPPASR